MAYQGVGGGKAVTAKKPVKPQGAYGVIANNFPKQPLQAPTLPQEIGSNLWDQQAAAYSGGGGYGGGGGGGYAAAPAPAPPRISDDEWLGQDSQYKGSLAALEQKLRDYEVEHNSNRDKGIQDYDNSLLRLGWNKGADGADGSWNQDDRTTSYGNAYQGQMGDFASRGLLQSTLYDQANTDMLGNFNRQKTDMDTSNTNFLEELARMLGGKKSDTQLGKDQARVEALARRAAAESGM